MPAATRREYNRKVLPRAVEENRALIAAMKSIAESPLADVYEAEAAKAGMPERRRYCLDIARELLFLRVRDAFYHRNASGPYPGAPPARDRYRGMDAGSKEAGYSMGDSIRYWKRAREIESFIDHYAQGRFGEAVEALARIDRM